MIEASKKTSFSKPLRCRDLDFKMVQPRIFENFWGSFYDDDVSIDGDDLYFWSNGEIKIFAKDLSSKLVLKLADGKIFTRTKMDSRIPSDSVGYNQIIFLSKIKLRQVMVSVMNILVHDRVPVSGFRHKFPQDSSQTWKTCF